MSPVSLAVDILFSELQNSSIVSNLLTVVITAIAVTVNTTSFCSS